MEFNQSLYRDLYLLRDQLKNQGRIIEGRAPTVCTDEALYEIVRLMPQLEEDFLCVSGLGQTFVDKYATQFLSVIKKNTRQSVAESQNISPETRETLKELEKKLVNINRRNRLLYISKITNKYAYDLFDSDNNYNPLDILFKGKTVKICDTSVKSNSKGQNGKEKYKRLVTLLREVNKDLREKGQFDLYIGYPFVKGRLLGEDFDIRAPLVLFPVEVVREADYISVSLDNTKDIVYNNNLILAHYKFNGINRPLPNNVIEDLSEKDFIGNLISFYKTEGIKLSRRLKEFSEFKDYLSGEFPSFQNGEMEMDENIVIGKFPTYASALQKDFNEILDQDIINNILENLLTTLEDIDYYSDSYAGEEELKEDTKPLTVSEHDLIYIGELNSSQENVITAIKQQDALVVQGPPGTGKSQTITSLISDYVNSGCNVLMVSEKKAALDVVYSRLGELNRFALLIDDINDKQNFYTQMEKILNIRQLYSEDQDELNTISDSIDDYIRRLELIAEKLYSANDFGIEMYKLYLMNRRLDLANPQDAERYKLIKLQVSPVIFALQYRLLHSINKKFKNESLVLNADYYVKSLKKAWWLDLVRENLSEYELFEFHEASQVLMCQIEEWRNKNFFSRLFSKGKVVEQINGITNKYFSAESKKLMDVLLGGNFVVSDISLYNNYVLSKSIYLKLNDEEKEYFKALQQVASVLNCGLNTSNDELFNFIVCESLLRFEAQNRDVLQHVNDFSGIISSLSTAISQKRKITKQRLEKILWENLGNIVFSKRQGEIARVVDSKRKWSVNKFFNKFAFELFRGIKIWLLTPEIASEILPLQTGLFDLAIFDEASQMYVEKGIPTIVRAKKVVIAGDSKQLRPSNLGAGRIEMDEDLPEEFESNAALEEDSLLDLARFKYVPPVLLNFHYRSKYEELIAFSNYAFYKGRLYVSPNVQSPQRPPIEVFKVENGLWVNRSNLHEARKIVELLKEFFEKRIGNQTVGIITFNSNQRDLIDDLIDEECAKNQSFATSVKSEIARRHNGEDIGLFVKNIENVQGDERDVIMFSIGYAKNENGRLVKNFGWLNQKGGENRLNVAISRAKEKVVIVTSFDPSELQVENAQNNGPKFLKKYLEYSFAISNGDKEKAKQILLSFGDSDNNGQNIRFDSDFENQVYDELKERGFMVETQIGIGGYSIDLAIKNNGRYILGIECDGKLYHSSKSARERDYHRQKYLESRGWKIHRIWSTNWWRNPQKEIEKVVTLIGSLV